MFCYFATLSPLSQNLCTTFNGINVFNILPEMIHDMLNAELVYNPKCELDKPAYNVLGHKWHYRHYRPYQA